MARRYTIDDSLSRRFSLAFATGMVLTLGSAALAASPRTAVNEWCPVMTDEKIDPAITVDYRGEVIGFCCDTCVKKFRANPAKYESRIKKLAAVASAMDGAERGHATRARILMETMKTPTDRTLRGRRISMDTITASWRPTMIVSRFSVVFTRSSSTFP